MARMNEVIKLPSNGRVYDTTELTLQNMTIAEEKFIYGSSSEKAITQILNNCILEEIDVDDLIVPDKHYALVRLRVLTYGEDYPVDIRCRNRSCGREFTHVVKLSELDVMELPESYSEPQLIELPVSKDHLKLVIPTGKRVMRYEALAKKKADRFQLNLDEVNYVYNLMISVVAVNDDELLEDELYQYIMDLSGRDSSYLKHQLSKIQVGYDTAMVVECPTCNSEIRFRLPMSTEFFRTKFND